MRSTTNKFKKKTKNQKIQKDIGLGSPLSPTIKKLPKCQNKNNINPKNKQKCRVLFFINQDI